MMQIKVKLASCLATYISSISRELLPCKLKWIGLVHSDFFYYVEAELQYIDS